MEEKSRLVIEAVGCEEEQARLALTIHSNNVDEAIRNFDTTMNDIAVIKGKVRSSITRVFGLFIIVVDIQQKKIIKLATVLTDNSLYDTNLKGNWFIFERKIYTIRLGERCLQNATQEMEQLLFDNLQYEKARHFFEALRYENFKETDKLLYELIARVQSLPQLKLDTKTEKMGKLYQKRKKYKINNGFQENHKINISNSHTPIELNVSLITGKKRDSVPAKFLIKGDMVMAEVTDKRDVASYISRLLGGVKKDKYVPLFSIIEEVKCYEDCKMFVKVRFSPGITGTSYINPSENIRIIRGRGILFSRRIRKFFIDITGRFRYNT